MPAPDSLGNRKAASTLADILLPCTQQEFVGKYWGKRFLHVPGEPGKFTSLLPWSVLNGILSQHRLDHPRLRLAKEGRTLPSTTFIESTRGRRGNQIPELRLAELNRELRDGATLIIDAIDEMYEPITALASALERVFHERIQVNAYAGWRTSHGFDVHWDDHDVLVLQIAGRKHWKIYGETRRSPLYLDVEPPLPPPSDPQWERDLMPGDLLYIPRGWWHVAIPTGEPTLHLTFGVNNRTGLDFLGWLRDKLRDSPAFRMDLPRFASREVMREHLATMRSDLLQCWGEDGLNLLDEFIKDQDARAEPRPSISLPWSATSEVLPDDPRVRLGLTAPRSVEFQRTTDGADIRFGANGQEWVFAGAAEPILRFLGENEVCSLEELARSAPNVDSEALLALVRDLVLRGLVRVYDSE